MMAQRRSDRRSVPHFDQADALADLLKLKGCAFIPCHRPNDTARSRDGFSKSMGKAPIDLDWTRRPYNSGEVIRRCNLDGRNMGLRIGGRIIVIDVDIRNGGAAGFKHICRDFKLSCDAFPRNYTGGGGWHCYARLPTAHKVRNTLADAKYAGVEFKGKNHQCIWPGSIHPSGKLYYRSPSHPAIADGIPLLPQGLVDAIAKPKGHNAVSGGIYSREQIAQILEHLNVIDFRSYDDWLCLLMSVHHACPDSSSEFITWSTSDPHFCGDHDQIEEIWSRVRDDRADGRTFRTLHYILREHGAGHVLANDARHDFLEIEDVDEELAEVTDSAHTFLNVQDQE